MKVLSYIHEHGLDSLTENLGIKVTQNQKYPELFCLNYCQIESPKQDPIVQECRTLVIQYTDLSWEVKSRAFDRFFNYGEKGACEFSTDMTTYEKIDGSLITLFHHNDEWIYRTKSMIMPEHDMTLFTGRSWKSLIEMVIDTKADYAYKDCSYMFELVAPDNRVVTKYDIVDVYLLSIRNNQTGEYLSLSEVENEAQRLGYKVPKRYTFNTIEDCQRAAKELTELKEGYVMYDSNNVPKLKVKSPAYLAAHVIRGETKPTPRRIMDLILLNEQDEYLSIFPEDIWMFQPYIDAYHTLKEKVLESLEKYNSIESQKDFALAIKGLYYKCLLFHMRRNNASFNDAMSVQLDTTKHALIENTKIKFIDVEK